MLYWRFYLTKNEPKRRYNETKTGKERNQKHKYLILQSGFCLYAGPRYQTPFLFFVKRLKLKVNSSGAASYEFSLIYCIMNLCPLNEFQLKPRVGAKGNAIAPKIYVLYTDGLKRCDKTFWINRTEFKHSHWRARALKLLF